jgi:hypothetical protein
MVGLRIVATSTRVRLFSIPVRFLRATASLESVAQEGYRGWKRLTMPNWWWSGSRRSIWARPVWRRVCESRAPTRPADAGAARLRHHHSTTAGDGGLAAPVVCAAGGDGVHQHLLEGGCISCWRPRDLTAGWSTPARSRTTAWPMPGNGCQVFKLVGERAHLLLDSRR